MYFLVALFLTSFFFIFVSLSLIRDYLSGELSLVYSATFFTFYNIFNIFCFEGIYDLCRFAVCGKRATAKNG